MTLLNSYIHKKKIKTKPKFENQVLPEKIKSEKVKEKLCKAL